MDTYIKNLIANFPQRATPLELDVIIEGGSFNGLYGLGSLMLIKKLEKINYIKIHRISGASIGGLLGFYYLIDKLDKSSSIYEKVRECFQKNLNLNCIRTLLQEEINNLSEEQFNKIRKDKLFLTFYESKSLKQIVKSEYTDKNDLMNTLLHSGHLPFFTSGTYYNADSEKNYFDGGMPYIYPERTNNDRKIMYISLVRFSRLNSVISIKNEKNIYGRILEGVLDAYKLFMTGEKSTMCSFMDTWQAKDFILLRIKQLVWMLCGCFIRLIYLLGDTILPYVKDTKCYNLLIPLLYNCYRDFILFYCL